MVLDSDSEDDYGVATHRFPAIAEVATARAAPYGRTGGVGNERSTRRRNWADSDTEEELWESAEQPAEQWTIKAPHQQV